MDIALPAKNARIKSLVDHFANGNVTKFVALLNEKEERVSQQQINRLFHIEKRTKKDKYPSVSTTIMDAILDRFKDSFDPMWLINGNGFKPAWITETEGSMLKEEKEKDMQTEPKDDNSAPLNNDALMGLIKSNNILAEANKKLADAHYIVAENSKRLLDRIDAAYTPSSMSPEIEEKFSEVWSMIAAIGSGEKKWKSKQQAIAELNKYVVS